MIVKFSNGDVIENIHSYTLETHINYIMDICTFTSQLFEAITLESEVEIWLDESTFVMKGTIDEITPGVQCTTYVVRTHTSVLIDSCINPRSTCEFRNLTAYNIIKNLIKPYNLKLYGKSVGSPLSSFSVELDAPVATIISQLCNYIGVVATTSMDGGLTLWDAMQEEVLDISFTTGINCKANISFKTVGLGSVYTIFGYNEFDVAKNAVNSTVGYSIRPKYKNLISATPLPQDVAIRQSKWLANALNSTIEELTIDVPATLIGLRKGNIILFTAEEYGLEAAPRLIESIVYVKGSKGESTTLKCVMPFKYGSKAPVVHSTFVKGV